MKMSKLLKFLLFSASPTFGVDDEGGGSAAESEGGEAVGTGNDARVALLDSIADSADRARESELADVNDDESMTPFKAPEAPLQEDAQVDDQVAELAVPLPKIKVNGVEMDLTPELIEKASKVAAADVHLAEAARIRDEAAKRAPTPVPAPAAATVVNQAEDDLALVRAIQMGTEEEAVRAVQKLRKAGPSQDDIARTIDARLNFNTALSTFNSEYADLIADPVLHQMVIDQDSALCKQGDSRPYLERYRDLGNGVRAWRDALVAANQKAPAAAVEAKQERKAAAPAAPKAAVARAAAKVEEDKEESTQSVIQNMARSRGGPQWMNGMSNV